MQKGKDLKLDREVTRTMEQVIGSLEEVYVLKMKRIRDSVVIARDFFTGILAVFEETRKNHQGPISKKSGELAILISGNLKFAGEINMKVFNAFNNYIQGTKCDIGIIGKIGDILYKQRGTFRTYRYFDLENEYPSFEKVMEILKYISSYEKITVFHGKFMNLAEQVDTQTAITGNKDFSTEMTGQKIQGREYESAHYIFEPSLEKVLEFFQNQMIGSLFKQTVYESSLAQLGSRIKTMEGAFPAIKERKAKLDMLRLMELRSLRNKKQQASLLRIFTNERILQATYAT
ncbi:hypothetical protein COT49_00955 [candidate division WWE3 bacterium CG08_land_8_20_14_0_20_40_13]|uniref:ATP synthase gamma chain n=1 Tax=candidate division WWE3 bacterium CG08_land_8_20_14_0_20_40_13 TaxID=1975084 RepID=A0A2H0XEC5_UNCKA|nr:MAG: hypothetical protein COT49_00955 [candidate division WWE3 bacterium CG08_land_8_20_14_0_20_40_13]